MKVRFRGAGTLGPRRRRPRHGSCSCGHGASSTIRPFVAPYAFIGSLATQQDVAGSYMFDQQQYLNDYVRVLVQFESAPIERAAEMIIGAWTANRTVFLCGNGGSAASAGHLAADLTKLTAPPRGPRLRAVALTDSLSAISAIANDFAYEEVFSEQLRAFGEAGDVVVGLSTSGSSPNVLRAIEYGNSIGASTLGITGRDGRKLRDLARHTIVVDSTSVQHVEDATMVAGHMLCLRVKTALEVIHGLTRRRPLPASGAAAPAAMPAASAPI